MHKKQSMASCCKRELAKFSTSPSVAKAQLGWGENINWVGAYSTYFVDGGTIRVGTPHNIERKYVRNLFRHLPDTFWNITESFQTYADTFQTYPHTFQTPSRHLKTPSRHSPYISWTPQTQSRVQQVRRLVGCVGGVLYIIQPLWGSILQVGTWNIFSPAEYPRWSRVWQ